MNAIDTLFAGLRRRREAALIPYLPVGYPTRASTLPLLHAAVEAGADLIELGVPFSDPVADGPTIQKASQVALANGVTLRACLDTVAQARRSGIRVPLVLMSYFNPLFNHGLERLAREAAEAGVDGLIVPDLPPEAAGNWTPSLHAAGLRLVYMVAPTTPSRRVQQIAACAPGFLYCVSTTGVTGARQDLSAELPVFLGRVREVTNLPLAVGFGITTVEHVRQVSRLADAAIVGSALINTIEQHPVRPAAAVEVYLKALKSATHS